MIKNVFEEQDNNEEKINPFKLFVDKNNNEQNINANQKEAQQFNIFDINTNQNQIKQKNKIANIFKEDEEGENEEEEEDDHIEENKLILNVENNKKKCSLNEHKENDAVIYCQECKVYMCNKCEKMHSGFLKFHHIYSLDKNINEIFTGLCLYPNHSIILEYYCKTHNQLCCAACLAKIKKKGGNGKHKDCEVYLISKIKNEKKENLKYNIKNLEDLSVRLEPSIKELKLIYEKINESKEKLKKEVQNIFTKIRNELNNREDKLLLEIDNLYFNDELIKQSEKLPKLVKNCLESGKINEKYWDDKNKVTYIINESIKIENTIKKINNVYDKIKEYNSYKKLEFDFNPKEEELKNNLLKEIQNFGSVKIIDNKGDNKNQNINLFNNNNNNNFQNPFIYNSIFYNDNLFHN